MVKHDVVDSSRHSPPSDFAYLASMIAQVVRRDKRLDRISRRSFPHPAQHSARFSNVVAAAIGTVREQILYMVHQAREAAICFESAY
jgi:hypothetical protein